MDFKKMIEKAKDKQVGQNTVSDYVLFTVNDENGNERKVMKSEMNSYFSKRGRKNKDDKLIFSGYQDYLISQIDFKLADLKTNSLGFVTYSNGEKWPVVIEIDGYKFTESAISYYATFKTRTPEQELAVMAGKAFDIIPLEEDEIMSSIKERLEEHKK